MSLRRVETLPFSLTVVVVVVVVVVVSSSSSSRSSHSSSSSSVWCQMAPDVVIFTWSPATLVSTGDVAGWPLTYFAPCGPKHG